MPIAHTSARGVADAPNCMSNADALTACMEELKKDVILSEALENITCSRKPCVRARARSKRRAPDVDVAMAEMPIRVKCKVDAIVAACRSRTEAGDDTHGRGVDDADVPSICPIPGEGIERLARFTDTHALRPFLGRLRHVPRIVNVVTVSTHTAHSCTHRATNAATARTRAAVGRGVAFGGVRVHASPGPLPHRRPLSCGLLCSKAVCSRTACVSSSPCSRPHLS